MDRHSQLKYRPERMRNHSFNRNMCDPVDQWFESISLYRKQVPRDGSCLFRAVAEQVCHSQSHHENLRHLALDYMLLYKSFFQMYLSDPLENHVNKMRNVMEWAGTLELLSLSLIFKVDMLVFTEVGLPATNMTKFDFPSTMMLYLDTSNHFDIVYQKHWTTVAGFCQGLMYELLYSKVFGMSDVMSVVDQMLHDPNSCFRKDSVNSEGQELDIFRIVEQVEAIPNSSSEGILNTSVECCTTEKGLVPPFPYRVAKALDPDIYRNTDLDIWIAVKREARFGPYDSKGLQIGAKVVVRMGLLTNDKMGDLLHGHIQSMTENQGPVEVFVEELGERVTVPYTSLEKMPQTPTRALHEDMPPLMGSSPPSYKALQAPNRGMNQRRGNAKKSSAAVQPSKASLHLNSNQGPRRANPQDSPCKEGVPLVSKAPIMAYSVENEPLNIVPVSEFYENLQCLKPEEAMPAVPLPGSVYQGYVSYSDAECIGPPPNLNTMLACPPLSSEVFGYPMDNYPYSGFVPYMPQVFVYNGAPVNEFQQPVAASPPACHPPLLSDSMIQEGGSPFPFPPIYSAPGACMYPALSMGSPPYNSSVTF